MKKFVSSTLSLFLALFAFVIYGCSGGSSSQNGADGGSDATMDGAGGEGGGGVKTFSLGGTVSGLSGKGLTLQSGGKTLAVKANGTFIFKTSVAEGLAYDITVATQPSTPTQQCTVASGKGTVTGNVTNVAVTCKTSKFTVSGAVIGLEGTGLVLQNNDTDGLTVSANGTFTFATPVESGSAFSVTVQTQPSGPTQTCTVVGGTGTVGGANVTDVMVNCGTDDFVIGGQVTGLAGGSVVLQDDGGDNLTVTANGTFAFATPVASGGAYAVTVLTQPSNPTQTCTVSMGTGTVGSANVTSVNVACANNTYTIGGTVSGLAGTGLVLQDNAGDNLTVSADGTVTFATPIASGGAYAVTVLTQPTSPTQTCAVTMGTGTVGGANVTDVAVTCATSAYTIGGTVSGLVGTGLVLQDNGGDNLTVTADGTFTFATPVASGASFAVTVLTQPGGPTQTCVISGGTGTIVAGNVTSVTVNCAVNEYTIGGTVSGLAGTLVLQDNAADNLTLTSNGSFAFATPLSSGVSYAVTVLTQPGAPSQTCVVSNGTGMLANSNITNVTVTCTTNTYTVGGTVSGLAAAESVVLQNNAADNLTVNADGTFTFAAPVASGLAFQVTVLTNPASPAAQTCAVTNGTGAIGGANVTNVTVTCTTNKYTIGGTVSGLVGTGLVLQDNGSDNLTVTTNGTFAFATSIASGGAYAVTVLQSPTAPSQTCTVTNGSGTVTGANVTSATVTCTTNKYTIGGTVTGLASGDTLVLQDNGADNLTVSASGAFTFATPLASGASYAVTILSQSGVTAQTCTVSGGTGTVGGGNVTSVAINCTTDKYSIGGTVSGLAGTGLVLQDNGGDNLTITANGTFSFATPIASDATYSVTVLANPASPSQTCVVANGSGTVAAANVTTVTVTCTTNKYTVGGTLSGLAATESVVLQDNGANNLTVNANGTFTFATPIPSGGAYAVTVLTNPSSPIAETCVVASGSGTVTTANVTNVIVTCTTNSYTIGGTVSGLAGTGLVLQDNGGDNLTVTANGTFTFATPVASGATYAVTVLQGPTTPSQTCVVANGSGSVTNANVTSVTVTCTTNKYTIGGTVTGLASGDTLVLEDNGADNLTVSASGSFTFATPLASGTNYVVTILSQSGVTAQTCTVSGGGGTVGGGDVTSVAINCTTNKYTVGGTVSGLAGTGLVLQDNGGDNLTITANGGFSFATPIASDATYSVTVLTNPSSPTQTCVVTNGAGTVAAANVTTVTVTCTTNKYTVGGTLSGLAAAESVVLQDNGASNLTLSANGAFTFATSLASGSVYAVTVLTNPASPSQNCVVTFGGGMVTSSNITSVVVTCTTDTCPAETTSDCVLTTANSGSTDTGSCSAGYSGSCSYSCSLGVWTQVTNTCSPNPCPAETTSDCVLTTTNSGSTDTGTCASGFTGSCSFSCSNGTWTQVSDTCTTPAVTFTTGATTWTVPTTGNYMIEAVGGMGGPSGGGPAGGLGAQATGSVALTAGEVLDILVGGNASGGYANSGAGGGGGTFVVAPGNTPLVVAGGGGGGGDGGPGNNASLTTSGTTPSGGGAGGTNGGGGTGNEGGGGAGFVGNGSVCSEGGGTAESFENGGAGASCSGQTGGAFGGGNGGYFEGGGAGGYSGGGGGGAAGGGGGGSYVTASATNVSIVQATSSTAPQVVITWL
jgi:predicted transcriptional regulator